MTSIKYSTLCTLVAKIDIIILYNYINNWNANRKTEQYMLSLKDNLIQNSYKNAYKDNFF